MIVGDTVLDEKIRDDDILEIDFMNVGDAVSVEKIRGDDCDDYGFEFTYQVKRYWLVDSQKVGMCFVDV